MPQTIDIHELDQGYSIARQLLVWLEENNRNGTLARDLAERVGVTGAQMGQWLRDLRIRGWVTKEPESPGSYIVRWYITPSGTAYLDAED